MTDEELIAALRNTPNWKRENFDHWKDLKTTYDRTPFLAADRLEALTQPSGTVTDAQVERAMKSWFGDDYQNGTVMGVAATMDIHGAMRAALEAAQLPARPAEGETMQSCGIWADETFGPATPLRRIARAEEELDEAKEAPPEKILEEIADAVICLAAAAHSAGGDLQEAINAKMAINRKRKWNVKGDGTGYHVPNLSALEGEGQ